MNKFDVARVRESVGMSNVFELFGIETDSHGYAPCPFHGEKTASFRIIPGDKKAHCFGCDKTADVFDMVMEFNNCDFKTACDFLNSVFNVGVGNEMTRDEAKAQKTQYQKNKEKKAEEARRKKLSLDNYHKALDRWDLNNRMIKESPIESEQWQIAIRDMDMIAFFLDYAELELMKSHGAK